MTAPRLTGGEHHGQDMIGRPGRGRPVVHS